MTQYRAIWPSGFVVVWRNLTWAEYRTFYSLWRNRRFERPIGLSLEIYRACYVSGPLADFAPAGIVWWVAQQQMTASPFAGDFKDVSRQIQLARKAVESSFLQSARAIVAAAFRYTFEEIDTWDADRFFLRLAQAEIVLGKVIEPGDPDKKTKNNQPSKPSRPALSRSQQIIMERVRGRGAN